MSFLLFLDVVMVFNPDLDAFIDILLNKMVLKCKTREIPIFRKKAKL